MDDERANEAAGESAAPRRGPRTAPPAGEAPVRRSPEAGPPTDEEIEALAEKYRDTRSLFPPAELPWGVSHGLAMLALYIILGFVFQLLGELAFMALGRDTSPAAAARAGIQIGGPCAAFLLAAYYFLTRNTHTATEAGYVIGLEIHRPLRAITRAIPCFVVGAGLLYVCIRVQNELFRIWEIKPLEQSVVQLVRNAVAEGPYEAAMLAVFVVLVIPVTEELLFRGLLYLPLRARLGPMRAALVVSLAFAAVHPYRVTLIPMLILAMILAWAVEATRTLWAAIIGHIVFNAVGLALIVISAVPQQ